MSKSHLVLVPPPAPPAPRRRPARAADVPLWESRRGLRIALRPPDPAEARSIDRWMPLAMFARAARLQDVPWLVLIEDFDFIGLTEGGGPVLHVYQHHQACELFVDETGGAWAPRLDARRKLGYRFVNLETRSAVWKAGLPHVADAVEFYRNAPATDYLGSSDAEDPLTGEYDDDYLAECHELYDFDPTLE